MPAGRDRGIAGVLVAQRGIVQRKQLNAAGIQRGAIAHRLAVGALWPVFPRVYAVGTPPREPLALAMAALLFAGRDAVLSHDSAAELWGLEAGPGWTAQSPGQITVVNRHLRSPPGLRVHRVRSLDRRDVRLRDGLAVTAPGRTLLDFAGGPGADVARALAELRVAGLVNDRDLREAIARAPHRRGAGAVTRLLGGELEPALTRSEAERRFLALVGAAQLRRPRVNARIAGHEVDFVWDAERLIAEVDGHRFHAHRAAFERDRRRDQALAASGYRVVRVTWSQIARESLAVAARLGQALAASPPREQTPPASSAPGAAARTRPATDRGG